MTTYDQEFDAGDEAQEYWDEYDDADADWGADWYCNHDVPNGCAGCAAVKREEDMLDAMTEDERYEYFEAQDRRREIEEHWHGF